QHIVNAHANRSRVGSILPLARLREREGPIAQRWEGEGIPASTLTRRAARATLSSKRARGDSETASSPASAADIAALRRDAGLLVADLGERGDPLADLLLRGQREAQPQPRAGIGTGDRPFGTRIERDPGIG